MRLFGVYLSIWLGLFSQSFGEIKVKSISLSLSQWHTEKYVGVEEYYQLPKVRGTFGLGSLDITWELPFQYVTRETESEYGLYNTSFLLGRGWSLQSIGPVYAWLQAGADIPIQKPNSNRNEPFVGSGNLFAQWAGGIQWKPLSAVSPLKLTVGGQGKVAVSDDGIGALAGRGSVDGYSFFTIGHPIKMVDVGVTLLHLWQKYYWKQDDSDEVKNTLSAGLSFNVPFGKYVFGVQGGLSFLSKSRVDLRKNDYHEEVSSEDYYTSLEITRYF